MREGRSKDWWRRARFLFLYVFFFTVASLFPVSLCLLAFPAFLFLLSSSFPLPSSLRGSIEHCGYSFSLQSPDDADDHDEGDFTHFPRDPSGLDGPLSKLPGRTLLRNYDGKSEKAGVREDGREEERMMLPPAFFFLAERQGPWRARLGSTCLAKWPECVFLACSPSLLSVCLLHQSRILGLLFVLMITCYCISSRHVSMAVWRQTGKSESQ